MFVACSQFKDPNEFMSPLAQQRGKSPYRTTSDVTGFWRQGEEEETQDSPGGTEVE